MMEIFCSEWADDIIELEIKVRRAEKQGWRRYGLPYKQIYDGSGIPIGNYVQTLIKD